MAFSLCQESCRLGAQEALRALASPAEGRAMAAEVKEVEVDLDEL